MNQVSLIGRLGADPELRATQSGTPVAKLSIAVERIGPGKETDWFDVVAFNKVAESLAQRMRKGCRVGVSGRLQQEKWTDKATGQKRSKISVIAQQIDFLDWPGQQNHAGQAESGMPDFGDEDTFGAGSDVPF